VFLSFAPSVPLKKPPHHQTHPASPFASVLTLRLADSVPAPGLPRTLRMSVSASQAALLTAAAGWDGDGARHHQAGSAAPSAAAAQPSALDTTAGIMAVLDATLAAAVVWSFDGEVFGAGLCVSPKNSGPGGGGLFKKTVPAKPSDALILALQAGAPIYVTHAVWVAVALPAGGGGAEEGGGAGDADQAAPWAAAAARAARGTPPPLPPALARILDQLAAADALLHGRHASTTPQPPPWSLSGSVNRLGAAAHAGLPTAAALAAAGRARAEAAAALAALAARPLAAARARAGMTLLKMQLAAADERFTDATAAAARLDRHVAGDPGMAAAVSLEAALDDGRLEDGVRLLGALLAHRGRLGEEGGGWESEEEGEESAKGGGGGGGNVE
jgi:bifunctional DNase/RNase